MKLKGIDVSGHNGIVDWQKASKEIDFAMIRVGWVGWDKQKHLDTQFHNNMKNTISAGVKVGAYVYSYAQTKEQAKEEARFILAAVKGYEVTYPLVIDVEDPRDQAHLTPDQKAAVILTFCNTIKEAGYSPALYTMRSWLKDNAINLERIKDIDIWLAEWGESKSYDNNVIMWQYTDEGEVAGVDGNVDMNYCYKAFEREEVLNMKTWSRTSKKELIKNHENEVKYLQSRLTYHGYPTTKDGDFGPGTERNVKAFQASNGLTRTGIIQEGDPTHTALLEEKPKPKVPTSPHFSIDEFKCRDGSPVPEKYYPNVQRLMDKLEEIRTACGNKPIRITSGYRTESYNKRCGGVSKSQHLTASAADIVVIGLSTSRVRDICRKINNDGGNGYYPNHGFNHVDVRGYYVTWQG